MKPFRTGRKAVVPALPIGVAILLVSTVFGSDWADNPQDIQKTFSAVHTIQTLFTQEKHLEILAKPLVSEGRFFYEAPDRVRWEYQSPIRTVFLLHDGKARRYTWRDGKCTRDSGAGVEAMRIVLEDMTHWLSGNFNADGTFTPEFVSGPPPTIRLVPREKSVARFIQHVELVLAPTPGALSKVEIVEGPSSSTSITFQDTRINEPIDDTLFKTP